MLTKYRPLLPDAALSDATDRLPHTGSLVPRVILRRLEMSASRLEQRQESMPIESTVPAIKDERDTEDGDDEEALLDAVQTSRCAVVISSGERGSLRRETCRLEPVTVDTNNRDDSDGFVAYRLLPSVVKGHDNINDNTGLDNSTCTNTSTTGMVYDSNSEFDVRNNSDGVSSDTRLRNIVIVLKKEVSPNCRGRRLRGGRKRRRQLLSREGSESYVKIRRDENRGYLETKRDELDVEVDKGGGEDVLLHAGAGRMKIKEDEDVDKRETRTTDGEECKRKKDAEIKEISDAEESKKGRQRKTGAKDGDSFGKGVPIGSSKMTVDGLKNAGRLEDGGTEKDEDGKMASRAEKCGQGGESLLRKDEDGETADVDMEGRQGGRRLLRGIGDRVSLGRETDIDKYVSPTREGEDELLFRDKDEENLFRESLVGGNQKMDGKDKTLFRDDAKCNKDVKTDQIIKESKNLDDKEAALRCRGQMRNVSQRAHDQKHLSCPQEAANEPRQEEQPDDDPDEQDEHLKNTQTSKRGRCSGPKSQSKSLDKIRIVKSPARRFRVVRVGGKGRADKGQKRGGKKPAGEDGETDEGGDEKLLEILPPKRRRPQHSSRDALTSESSVERFRREFPHHNWLAKNESGESEPTLEDDETEEEMEALGEHTDKLVDKVANEFEGDGKSSCREDTVKAATTKGDHFGGVSVSIDQKDETTGEDAGNRASEIQDAEVTNNDTGEVVLEVKINNGDHERETEDVAQRKAVNGFRTPSAVGETEKENAEKDGGKMQKDEQDVENCKEDDEKKIDADVEKIHESVEKDNTKIENGNEKVEKNIKDDKIIETDNEHNIEKDEKNKKDNEKCEKNKENVDKNIGNDAEKLKSSENIPKDVEKVNKDVNIQKDGEKMNKDDESIQNDVEKVNKDENIKKDVVIINKYNENIQIDVEINKDVENIQKDVEINKDVENIQKDVEIINKDVENIQKDVEIINKDVENIQKDVEIINKDVEITQKDVKMMYKDVENIQKDVEIMNKNNEKIEKDSKKHEKDAEKLKTNLEQLMFSDRKKVETQEVIQSKECEIKEAVSKRTDNTERMFPSFERTATNNGIFRAFETSLQAKENEIRKRLGQDESSVREIFRTSRRPAASHDSHKATPTFPAWTLPSAYTNYPFYANYKTPPRLPPPQPSLALPTTTSDSIFCLPPKPTTLVHNYRASASTPTPTQDIAPPRIHKRSPPPAHSQRPFESSGQITNRAQWNDIYKQFTIPANRMAGSRRSASAGGRSGNVGGFGEAGGAGGFGEAGNTGGFSSAGVFGEAGGFESAGGYKSINRGHPLSPATENTVSTGGQINNNNNSSTKWYTTPRPQSTQPVQQKPPQNAKQVSSIIDLASGDALRVQQAIARRALTRKEGERVDPLSMGVYPGGRSLVAPSAVGAAITSNSEPLIYSSRLPQTGTTIPNTPAQLFPSGPSSEINVLNLSSKTGLTAQTTGIANAHHFIQGLQRHLDTRPVSSTTWDPMIPSSAALPLDLSRPVRAPTRPQQQHDSAVDYSRRGDLAAGTTAANASVMPLFLSQYMYPTLNQKPKTKR